MLFVEGFVVHAADSQKAKRVNTIPRYVYDFVDGIVVAPYLNWSWRPDLLNIMIAVLLVESLPILTSRPQISQYDFSLSINLWRLFCRVQAAQYHLPIEGDLLACRLILGRLQSFLN